MHLSENLKAEVAAMVDQIETAAINTAVAAYETGDLTEIGAMRAIQEIAVARRLRTRVRVEVAKAERARLNLPAEL